MCINLWAKFYKERRGPTRLKTLKSGQKKESGASAKRRFPSKKPYARTKRRDTRVLAHKHYGIGQKELKRITKGITKNSSRWWTLQWTKDYEEEDAK